MPNCFAKVATVPSRIKVRSVDGGHLYDKTMPSTMLLMEIITPQGNRIPLAVALCDGENEENWDLFFKSICEYSSYDELTNTTIRMSDVLNKADEIFMSDRDNGLIGAIAKNFPDAMKRSCILHFERNLLSDATISTSYNIAVIANEANKVVSN